MKPDEWDAIVVGAGVAGLTVTAELRRSGLNVICLEAQGRAGGRILTVHDPATSLPIELGAEFIHGWPPEIWSVIDAEKLPVSERSIEAVYKDHGSDRSVDRVLDAVNRAAEKGDEPFAAFLARSDFSEDEKRWTTAYVEGYHAARADTIGIASLAKDLRAADEIDGDRTFSLEKGYDSLVNSLLQRAGEPPRFDSIVEGVIWKPGAVSVKTRQETLRGRCAILTVPLGVLQAGAIVFDPEPAETLAAARKLAVGPVSRVTLRLERAFWEHEPDLRDKGFIFSQEPFFPTWWTPLPMHAPVITGWTGGTAAERLQGLVADIVVDCAILALERITNLRIGRPQAAYFHDWRADPFARGAYSYVPANALPAREKLAEPVENTLFFAGEATNLNGHGATVHGAIASGVRAAGQVKEVFSVSP